MLYVVPSPLLSYDPELCTLIDTTAAQDAHADRKAGRQDLFQLMEALFAGGHVRRSDWERYCGVYAVESARL